MAESAAIGIIALTNSETAKKTACEGFMPTFDAKTATVEQAQTYAACVQTLYPEAVNVIYAKGIFVLFLLGMVVAWARQHREGSPIDFIYFMGIFMGGILAGGVASLVILILYGVYWVFS